MQIDKDIWLQIEDGNELAYEKMYTYYYKRFYIYGRKITEHLDTIEDGIQEVMIYIWHNRSTLSGIKYPAAYFYTSFRNLLINKLKTQGEIVSDMFVREEAIDSAEDLIITKEEGLELKSKLKKATGFLTARQSEAIFLRFYEELSYEEVAEVLGITIKATYKIMARALSELREKYVHVFILFLQISHIFLN